MVAIVLDNQDLFKEFALPKQDAKTLSFCSAKPRQLQSWLNDLASTHVKQVSIVLYKLLPEVNHLDINGSQRLGLMVILRPYVHNCIDGLAEEFLKQPLNLTESMTKIAAIAQALQRHLCDGYLIAIHQLLRSDKLSATAQQELSLALYYAIHGLGQLLYRSYQLYVPQPPLLWNKLHQLYRLALKQNIQHTQIPDELLHARKSLSAQQAYMRAILLACSQANQLRQIDIQYLYTTLESWSSMASIDPMKEAGQSLYCIDATTDQGPFYQSRQTNSEHSHGSSTTLYTVNLCKVIALLNDQSASAENEAIQAIPSHLRESLLAHLKTCWNQEHTRLFTRQQSEIELEVCIGLRAAHQQLLGTMTFDDFLKHHGQSPNNEFNLSYDPLALLTGQSLSTSSPSRYESQTSDNFITVTATDVSEQGYCLRWSSDVPPQVKSGEIILLKKPGTTEWQAGAIKWAQRLDRHTYIGVQLFGGHAEASAACTTLKNGTETPFFRTLLLRNAQGEALSSLITPTVPFSPKQLIQLQTEESCLKAKLDHLLLSSGSISQFSYQHL